MSSAILGVSIILSEMIIIFELTLFLTDESPDLYFILNLNN